MGSTAPTKTIDRAALSDLLNRFAHVAATGTDARDLTDWVMRQVADLTGWPVAHALIVDAHGSVTMWSALRSGDSAHAAYTIAAESIVMNSPTGLMHRTITTRRPNWVSDFNTESPYPRSGAAQASGLRSIFAIPVVREDQVVAIVQFLHDERIDPDTEFLDSMSILGFVLGAALSRIQLREESVNEPSRLHRIHDAGITAYVSLDADGCITEWTPEAERLFGWSRNEVMYRKAAPITLPPTLWDRHGEILDALHNSADTEMVAKRIEIDAPRRDGSTFHAEVTQWVMFDGSEVSYGLFFRDIREDRQRALGHVTDNLTKLPNRASFIDQLTQHLATVDAANDQAVVMLVGLRRFKHIDQSSDHQIAHRALQIVAQRLTDLLTDDDVVARVSGDEFGILLAHATQVGDVAALCQKILATINAPFRIDGQTLALKPDIGAAFRLATGDVRSWLGSADAALLQARTNPQSSFEIDSKAGVYRPHSGAGRPRLHRAIQNALRRSEFELHYQPIFELKTKRITGAEAVIRWHHPDLGMLLPGDFIPEAEESGLIAPIGAWVLKAAGRQLRHWYDGGLVGLDLAVNLGAPQLTDPGIVDQVAAALHTAGIASEHHTLTLEVTETTLMTDPEIASMRLSQLRALGAKVAIDDFGTGYSSLAYLKWFDVDVIKIDMSFVHGMATSPTDRAIVQAIIDLAVSLNMDVIAEGVESDEQLTLLGNAGCQYVQGFVLGRPMPIGKITKLLHAT